MTISISGLRRTIAVAAVASTLFAIAACSTPAEEVPTADPAAEAAFDQELHDLLPDYIKDAGVVSAGALFQTPPGISASTEDPNVPVGAVPDLAALVGEVLGVDIEFTNTQWPNQLPGVQSGALDILWGQVSVTAEREQGIVDLVPWAISPDGLLVAAGNPHDIDGLASLCGLKVAVPNGSTALTVVQEASEAECEDDPIDLLEYAGGADAIAALRGGTVDAWMSDYASQVAQATADPDTFEAVAVPEEESAAEYNGIAVSKENPGLTEALAGALTTLLESGAYDEVMDEWGIAASAITPDELTVNPYTGTAIGEMEGPTPSD